MSRRYESDEQPMLGDDVIIMKGDGPGGKVMGMFQEYAVIELWHGNTKTDQVPMLCEPEALLLKTERAAGCRCTIPCLTSPCERIGW